VYSKFPADILRDENTMNLLTLCAKRIEHLQVVLLIYCKLSKNSASLIIWHLLQHGKEIIGAYKALIPEVKLAFYL